MHLERVVKQTNARPQVLKRIVGVLVAVDFTCAISEFDGLVNVVVSRVDSLGFRKAVLGASRWRSNEQHGCDRKISRANPHVTCVLSALRRSHAPVTVWSPSITSVE